MATLTTVLYIHGLEAGPRGKKTVTLSEAGFAVVSKQMPCGRNQTLRDPLVLGLAAATLSAAALAAYARGWPGALVVLVVGVLSGLVGAPYYLRRMFRRSIAVQLRALTENQIDAVVGSSFGGAVAVELLRRGAWSGPTVLLCPAQSLIAARFRLAAPKPLAALGALARQIVVVHSPTDETVPFADSKALVAGSLATLIEVSDDHRLSTSATIEAFTRWIARATET